ncbi:MAG: alanine racemase [Eubacteriales bacterium]|nr:alanine racemase [Eubacteriales bacterium]
MLDIQKRTWAEIDLGAIENNYKVIRREFPAECRFLGVVKADAYGHGAVPVAKRLEALGAEYFGVACIDEAAQLRAAGITKPILILGPTPAVYADMLADLDVTQAVDSEEQGLKLSQALSAGKTLRIHLKLDTGMGRVGFRAAEEERLMAAVRIMALPNLEAEGVFTHFAVSDEPDGVEYTHEQYDRFAAAIKLLEEASGRQLAIRHCANSGAVVNYREYGLDMVRPGLLTYGYYNGDRKGLDLKPAMALRSRVAAVTKHRAGDTISYGRTFTATRDCTLAVVPVGYADGLHRCLSNRMEMMVNGKRVPQVGRICMDMCMADVTELDNVQPGDVVTIFGPELSVDEQAALAGTISYEMVCSVSRRVPRVYINE